LIDSSPKNDVVVLNKMLCEVEETWIRLSTKSVDRQRQLEEAHKSEYMLPDVNESFEETETLPIVEELIGEFSNPSSTGSPHTQYEIEPLIEPLTGLPSYGLASWPFQQLCAVVSMFAVCAANCLTTLDCLARHGLFFTRWIVNPMLNLLKRTMIYPGLEPGTFGLAVSIAHHHTI
jgi:arylsulfatase A-like enzyme